MKYSLAFVFIIFVLTACAQTDSTAIKLQEYKTLHEKGLISDKEYEVLKGKLLEIPTSSGNEVVIVYPKKDTVDMRALERTYKAQIITGSMELATGALLVGLFVHFRNEPLERNSNGVYTSSIRQARICLVASGVFCGVGLYSVIRGSKNRQKYINLSASPGTVSFQYIF